MRLNREVDVHVRRLVDGEFLALRGLRDHRRRPMRKVLARRSDSRGRLGWYAGDCGVSTGATLMARGRRNTRRSMLWWIHVALAAVPTRTGQWRLCVLLAPIRRHLLHVVSLADSGQLRLLTLAIGLGLARLRHRVLLMLVVDEHLILGVLLHEEHLVRWALRCISVRRAKLLLRGSLLLLLLLLLLELLDLRATLAILLLDEHGLAQRLLVGCRAGATRGSQLLLRVLRLGKLLEGHAQILLRVARLLRRALRVMMRRVLTCRHLVAVRRSHHLTACGGTEALLLLLQLRVVGLGPYQWQVVSLLGAGELATRASVVVRRVRGEARKCLRIVVGALRVYLVRQVLLEDILLVARGVCLRSSDTRILLLQRL